MKTEFRPSASCMRVGDVHTEFRPPFQPPPDRWRAPVGCRLQNVGSMQNFHCMIAWHLSLSASAQ